MEAVRAGCPAGILRRQHDLCRKRRRADYDCLRAACPSLFSDVPMGGLFSMYVTDTEAAGGVSSFYGVLPANFCFANWAKARWPTCSVERECQLFKGDQKG